MQKDKIDRANKAAKSIIKTFQEGLFANTSSSTPQILSKQRLLRALTCIDINFMLYSYFYLLEKCTSVKLEELKIGIIGFGVIGRLLTNMLIVLSKGNRKRKAEGLVTSNISISTRQTQHLTDYTTQYGIKVVYDNEQVMEDNDVVFVCTPSTLDNWILVDLKEAYEKRCSKQLSAMRPLVFILTSNVNQIKCKNIFGNGHFVLPVVSYSSLEEFMTNNPNFKDQTNETKIELTENFVFEKVRQNVGRLYNIMAYVLCNLQTTATDEQSIDKTTHQDLYNCFRKPNLEEVYKQRCKRWHSTRMNFMA